MQSCADTSCHSAFLPAAREEDPPWRLERVQPSMHATSSSVPSELLWSCDTGNLPFSLGFELCFRTLFRMVSLLCCFNWSRRVMCRPRPSNWPSQGNTWLSLVRDSSQQLTLPSPAYCCFKAAKSLRARVSAGIRGILYHRWPLVPVRVQDRRWRSMMEVELGPAPRIASRLCRTSRAWSHVSAWCTARE